MGAIPDAALDDRLAFVGTAGSGKTYAAGTAVERLLARKARCVIVDPLDVWWGLRLRADGVTPSVFPVVIFGGAHADLPINEHAGTLLGETVAGTSESCIVSLGEFGTKAAERRFMLAFLTAFYRHANNEPVHLIFDEADMWAPERMLDKEGDLPRLKGQMETIVRRGRVRGFIPWLITQRPAVLSKDVLSQADGLIAMKLTASQDRDALGAWIEGQADKSEEKRILARLPQVERGSGVVWIPGRGILEEVAFPQKVTFDSSRTPKRGEKKRVAELKPIDLGALKERMATVETEAKANDPKVLRAEIAELKRQLSRQAPTAPDATALAIARNEGFEEGARKGRHEAYGEASMAIRAMIGRLGADVDRQIEEWGRAVYVAAPVPAAPKPAVTPPILRDRPAQWARSRPAENAQPGASMSKAERRILTALAQYPQGRTKVQVAVLTGYAVDGGGFNNGLGSCRSKGWLEGTQERLTITPSGLQALGSFDPLPHGRALLDHWLGQCSKAERLILEAVAAAYPRSLGKEELASLTGYEASGGGFNNALGRLRTLELISRGAEIRASDDLFG